MLPVMPKGKPRGRLNEKPFVHRTPELERVVLDRLADGRSLRSICAEPGMPTAAAVVFWAARDEDFRARYLEARRVGLQLHADSLLDLAEAELGSASMPAVQARKLQIDTVKFLLVKLLPEYADSVQHSHLLAGEARIQVYLPIKGSNGPVIDGTSELLEDGSES
jgi:hypothetical protein